MDQQLHHQFGVVMDVVQLETLDPGPMFLFGLMETLPLWEVHCLVAGCCEFVVFEMVMFLDNSTKSQFYPCQAQPVEAETQPKMQRYCCLVNCCGTIVSMLPSQF